MMADKMVMKAGKATVGHVVKNIFKFEKNLRDLKMRYQCVYSVSKGLPFDNPHVIDVACLLQETQKMLLKCEVMRRGNLYERYCYSQKLKKLDTQLEQAYGHMMSFLSTEHRKHLPVKETGTQENTSQQMDAQNTPLQMANIEQKNSDETVSMLVEEQKVGAEDNDESSEEFYDSSEGFGSSASEDEDQGNLLHGNINSDGLTNSNKTMTDAIHDQIGSEAMPKEECDKPSTSKNTLARKDPRKDFSSRIRKKLKTLIVGRSVTSIPKQQENLVELAIQVWADIEEGDNKLAGAEMQEIQRRQQSADKLLNFFCLKGSDEDHI